MTTIPDGTTGGIDPLRVLKALRTMAPDVVVEPGVTAGDALAVMTAPPTPAGSRFVDEQVYGTAGAGGRELTMKLYAADEPGAQRPGVVFIHGGGFIEGFPEMCIRYANHLAAQGYVTACIRYRLATEQHWPACLNDAKAAVRWMRANAHEIGLDPQRLAVAGGSAGGVLSALVAGTPGQLEGEGGHAEQSSAVAAAVLWYPAVDLRPSSSSEPLRTVIPTLFGPLGYDDETAAEASAACYVEAMPPTLTMIGDADPIATLPPVEAYHQALDRVGTPNKLVVFPGLGHSFDYSMARWTECAEVTSQFLAQHL